MLLRRSTRITHTLTLLILLASGLVTTLSSGLFILNDQRLLQRQLQLAAANQAKLLAAGSAVHLSLKRNDLVQEMLVPFSTQPDLISAALYDDKQQLFAWITPQQTALNLIPPQPDLDGAHWYPDYFTQVEPVMLQQIRVGTVYLGYDRRGIDALSSEYLYLTGSILLLSLAFALLLAVWMQRIVSQPILALTEFFAQVGQTQDYTLRLPHQRQDELGQLIDSVNATLTIMEQQQKRLNQHIHHAESLVGLRTAELRAANVQLAQEAHYDSLTELPNRRLLQDRMRQAFRRLRGSQRQVGVIFLDLDGFKQINDTHGHNIGDEVLRIVASRISGAVRLQDTVARLGGDEFCVLLEDLDDCNEATQVAQRVISALCEPMPIQNLSLTTGGSIGIAFHPQDAATPDDLIQHADSAMYQAKRTGKGRYVCYHKPGASSEA
jgi:diguanylate cyclase (GGDEF)-like protein